MRHSVIIGACQETLPKLRRGDIEEAGRAEPESRACLSPNIPQTGKTQHGSARVLNSEPEARLESSASRFEAERSASGVPETICRDPRARLVATRPRGVNAAIRTRFSPAEDDAVRTRPLNKPRRSSSGSPLRRPTQRGRSRCDIRGLVAERASYDRPGCDHGARSKRRRRRS
jgi:hypothetical protein